MSNKESRIRILKIKIRKAIQDSFYSSIHSTDNTSQAMEYINDIWGDAENFKLNKEVNQTSKSENQNSLILNYEVLKHKLKERFKRILLDFYE